MPQGRNATDLICYIRATALGLSVSWSISKQHRSFSSKDIENSFCSGALRTEIKGPSCSSNYTKSLVCCSSNYRKSLVTVIGELLKRPRGIAAPWHCGLLPTMTVSLSLSLPHRCVYNVDSRCVFMTELVWDLASGHRPMFQLLRPVETHRLTSPSIQERSLSLLKGHSLFF